MQSFPWLTVLIVAPAIGALLVWVLPTAARKYARHIGVAISLIVFAGAVGMATQFDASATGYQFSQVASWIPQLGVSYAVGINGIGLTLILLSTLLVPVVLIAAWKEQETPRRQANYVALILILEAFMVAIFAARDVFMFYVVFEAMLIPVYFLIGSFGGPGRRYAAVKFLLYSLVGGLIMLAAVIGLYFQGPGGPQGFLVDSLTGISMSTTTERLLFLGFFIAFAIKAPMFPVHTWLPDAAQQAPVGTSVLLVGVLDKVGTFGMITLCLPLFPDAAKWAAPVIIVLAVISILYGALLAIGQTDILRLIAYTSVSHFGFIVLGIFAFTPTSEVGSTFYMVNHGLSTGALFLLAGFLIKRGKSQSISTYGGMQKTTPVLAGTFLVVGLSAIALPGLSTFVSEFLVLAGTFEASKSAAIFAALGVILAALYILLLYQKVFTGPPKDELKDSKDLNARELWVVAPLIALMLVLGFQPSPALNVLRPAATQTVQQVQADSPATPATNGGDN